MTVLPIDISTTYWRSFATYCVQTYGSRSILIAETEMSKWGGVIDWDSSWTVTFEDDTDAMAFILRWS